MSLVSSVQEEEYYNLDRESMTSETNEYNVRTLINTIEDEVTETIIIPGFQRHFVWNKKQASRLVESIICGMPVPQIFFFAKDDKLVVIDGQQRLMTLFYFYKQKFPRKSFRTMHKAHKLSKLPLEDKEYFEDFKLYLPARSGMAKSRLDGKLFEELDHDDKLRFHRYAIKSVTITPNRDKGDGIIYEVFNRLNSGTALKPQEVRRCVYDSQFYDMLYEVNKNERWRTLCGKTEQDKDMKDEESILRGFALLNNNYVAPMRKFLDTYSSCARTFSAEQVAQMQKLFESFLDKNFNLSLQRGNRFSRPLFEAAFVASCKTAYKEGRMDARRIDAEQLAILAKNEMFTGRRRSNTQDVRERLRLAHETLMG